MHIPGVQPGASGQGQVTLAENPGRLAQGAANDVLQVALKTNELNIAYFADTIRLEALLQEDGSIDTNAFLELWRSLSGTNESSQVLSVTVPTVEPTTQKLGSANVFLMAHRKVRCTCPFSAA